MLQPAALPAPSNTPMWSPHMEGSTEVVAKRAIALMHSTCKIETLTNKRERGRHRSFTCGQLALCSCTALACAC